LKNRYSALAWRPRLILRYEAGADIKQHRQIDRMRKKILLGRIIICVALLLSNKMLSAQDKPSNLACWVGYEMYLPFHEGGRWGLLLEGYSKGNQFLSKTQGAFYRIGANYYLKNGNRFGAGYAYQWNVPYDDVHCHMAILITGFMNSSYGVSRRRMVML